MYITRLYVVIYIIISLQLFGCASFSTSPKACEESVKNELYPAWFSIFIANIFQIGECAMSSKLRIETGSYYKKNKERIRSEIKGEWDNIRFVGYLGELFNCTTNDAESFKKFLLKNEFEIFGSEEYLTEPRQVMLNINKLIKKDADLSVRCK